MKQMLDIYIVQNEISFNLATKQEIFRTEKKPIGPEPI